MHPPTREQTTDSPQALATDAFQGLKTKTESWTGSAHRRFFGYFCTRKPAPPDQASVSNSSLPYDPFILQKQDPHPYFLLHHPIPSDQWAAETDLDRTKEQALMNIDTTKNLNTI